MAAMPPVQQPPANQMGSSLPGATLLQLPRKEAEELSARGAACTRSHGSSRRNKHKIRLDGTQTSPQANYGRPRAGSVVILACGSSHNKSQSAARQTASPVRAWLC